MLCLVFGLATLISNVFLVFGLATLIFNGLEIAMHATMNDKNCVDDVVIAHPILQVSMMTIMKEVM